MYANFSDWDTDIAYASSTINLQGGQTIRACKNCPASSLKQRPTAIMDDASVAIL